MSQAEPGPGPTTFELAEGATFTLSDGSAVTVRGNELEMSDGRRLPMPAAGETITVERTETRPDGGTVRIKHTIRLSEAAPEPTPKKVQTNGDAKDGDEEGDNAAYVGGDRDNDGKEEETSKTDADEIRTLPETPHTEPTKEQKPAIMGLSNAGKRSLRSMLWGSIPEGDDVVTYSPSQDQEREDPKSLLHPQHSIMEVNESDNEDDEETPEAPEASENANESFEFEAKERKLEAKQEPPKDVAAAVAEVTETAGKVSTLALGMSLPEEARRREPAEPRESSPEEPSESSTVSADEIDRKADPDAQEHHDKPVLARQGRVPSAADILKDVSGVIVVSVGIPTYDELPTGENKPAEPFSEESSGIGAGSDGTPPASKAASGCPAPDADDEPSNREANHELHLKLTPILRNLESQPPTSAAEDAQREPRNASSEERKGTVPPNTPAVTEDRDPVASAEVQEPNLVSVPKVVSYYESITPSKQPWSSEDASPRVRDDMPVREPPKEQPEARTIPEPEAELVVPKLVNFAVAMEPQKVYLSNQEPEEMENIPIPQAQTQPSVPQQEPVREEACTLQAVSQVQTVRTVPVQAQPVADTLPYLVKPEHDTPEPNQAATAQTEKEQNQTEEEPKSKPREYNPALFEHEPKRPLLLTSETSETSESAPPYEPGLHGTHTLPMAKKAELTSVVTEQPPPFGDEEGGHDPHDPFLPDNPRPGTGKKVDGWLGVCLDLCCCCWAP